MMPVAGLEAWKQQPEEERKAQESKMQTEWNEWSAKNKNAIKDMGGAGATKEVSTGGIADIKNDIMLYGVIEAESSEAAAELMKSHPHLAIPESTIQVMSMNSLPGMG